MVFHVKGVPALAVHGLLPFCEGLFELYKVKGSLDKVGDEAVCLHVGEVYHHVQHLVLALSDVAERHVGLHARSLAHGEAIVKVQHLVLEFGKVVVHLGEIGVILHTRRGGELDLRARQALGLGDIGYNVLAEAVDAHVQPEAHDVLDLLAHLGVCHVEVGLLFGKDVEVPLVEVFVILPGAALEQTVPVVGRALFPLALAPVVVIVIGIVRALFTLDKPGVLIGGVVDDQVHEYPQTALVCAVEHLFENLQIAEIRMDAFVIGYVVAVVGVGGGIKGRKPYAVDIERGNVVQLRQNAPQIADTVAVAVAERAAPDLIYGHFLVPAFLLHKRPPER